MLIYLYSWHFAPRLKTSNKELSSYSLYCQDCGKSDKYLGCAENIETALEIINPHLNLAKCNNCEKCGNFDYCINNCKEIFNQGKFDFAETLNTINYALNKDCHIKPHYVYLISKNKENPKLILLGEKNNLPNFVCLNKEQVNIMGLTLLSLLSKQKTINVESFEKVFEREYENKFIHVFSCSDNAPKEITIYGNVGSSISDIYRYRNIDRVILEESEIDVKNLLV